MAPDPEGPPDPATDGNGTAGESSGDGTERGADWAGLLGAIDPDDDPGGDDMRALMRTIPD